MSLSFCLSFFVENKQRITTYTLSKTKKINKSNIGSFKIMYGFGVIVQSNCLMLAAVIQFNYQIECILVGV